jgi:GNAT superfamily N-acetyltransferase
MQFRSATLADVPVLAELNRQLIEDEGHRNPMGLVELGERMRAWVAGEYRVIVFEDAAGPAGYAVFRSEEEWIYVRQFFVARERRRQGVGRRAVEWLVKQAWNGAWRVRLDVLAGNGAARAFWRSVGFGEYCVTLERTIES